MDIEKILALIPNVSIPTNLVLQMVNALGQLANSSLTYQVWAEVNRLVIEQAQAAEKKAAEKAEKKTRESSK